MTDKTQFDYLLNAFERASQSEKPADLDYASKRKALYAYVRGLEGKAQQAAVESEREKVLPYPDILCPDLAEILGKPNFWCGPIAHVFQAAGYDIPKKAEGEQAFVIHWLVKIYLRHGADWRPVAGKELNELVSKLESQQPAQADKDKP